MKKYFTLISVALAIIMFVLLLVTYSQCRKQDEQATNLYQSAEREVCLLLRSETWTPELQRAIYFMEALAPLQERETGVGKVLRYFLDADFFEAISFEDRSAIADMISSSMDAEYWEACSIIMKASDMVHTLYDEYHAGLEE